MLNRNVVHKVIILIILTSLAIGVWIIPSKGQAHNESTDQHQDGIQLCVENLVETVSSEIAFEKISTALRSVEQHPQFSPAGLDRGSGPQVIQHCPSEPTIRSAQWMSKYGAPDLITKPGDLDTFVFIVSEEEARKAFGDVYPRRTTQEIMCEGDTCGEVSSALYVTPQELNDPELLARSLSWGIGLIPEGEKLPTELAPAEEQKK